jgi:fibronectin type 3 domain-containing protein
VNRRRTKLVALALLGLIPAACGKKGPPVAPEQRLPTAPTGLTASIDDAAILVTWILPKARVDGTPMKDLAEAKLFRREDSPDAPLKPAMLSSGRVVGYEEVATLRPDSTALDAGWSGGVQWVDRKGLVVGHRYVYVATAIDSVGRSSPPSARKVLTFLASPNPPTDVQASIGDHQVALRWKAPSEFTDGTPATGEIRYLVLRATGDGPLSPLTPEPIANTAHTDTGLANEVEYRYAVRGVRVDARAVATGLASSVVAATPRKTTPPRPPTNLAAIPLPGTVRLAWNRSPDATVALYAVYRAAASGEFTRIATTAANITTYIDRTAQSGVTYRYAVTAIDDARDPNESPRSAEATVTVP